MVKEKELVIVFVKNIQLGKVKTRLAKTIGNQAAFEVYEALVEVTEQATKTIEVDKRIYFSQSIVKDQWLGHYKAVQQGADLGERMKNAFKQGFKDGYSRIVLIGSDLPDINKTQIEAGLKALTDKDVVFGPAEDGGYYLIGLSKMHDFIFNDKPWSQTHLLETTVSQLQNKNTPYATIKTLNDIDTFEDLEKSNFYKNNTKLQARIKALA